MTPDRRLEQIAADAMHTMPLDRHGHPRCCRHMPDAGLGAICGMHPVRVDCLDCFRRHIRGHGLELEHTCDVCDVVTRTIHGAALPWVARFVDLPRGVTMLVRVFVCGFGLCPACMRQVEEVAA